MDEKSENQFLLKGKDAEAVGEPVDGGFVVRAGAIARKEIVPSAIDSVTQVHAQLLSDGVLIEENGRLRFTKDHVFASASGASSAVLGRTSNGWIEWKQADGRTLSQVKRVARQSGEPMLSDVKRQQIIDKQRELLDEGRIYTKAELQQHYATFRGRFGPEILKGVDGEALLELIHGQGNKDSLVYWLEFKHDDEFETRRFGSIAGGSALKFRLFRRKETGHWQAPDEAHRPKRHFSRGSHRICTGPP